MNYVRKVLKPRCREVGSSKEFRCLDDAANYIASKYGQNTGKIKDDILDDRNCDALVFEDGSVIIYE